MSQKSELKRQLGLGAASALVVGEVVGVGIFLTPAGMAKSLGSPLLLLVVWLLMGAMALCGALCYGELAARYPEAGGSYVYLREAYGRRIAFLYGWMVFLVLDPGLTAAFAVGLASYAGYIVPLSPVGQKLVGTAAILIIAAINMRGVQIGGRALQALTVLKIGLLLFIAVWGFGRGLGDWSHFTPFVAQRSGSDALGAALSSALVGAFFAFAGWWDASKLTGEVRDPARTLPRALTLGVLVVTIVYVLTSAVFIYLVPLARVTSGETFAAQAGEVLFGRIGGQTFAAMVVVSVSGSLLAFMMGAPRVYYAMARDGLFIKSIATLHPRFNTPARAIIWQAALASLLVAVGTFQEIVAYFFFMTILFIALTVAALLVLRRRIKFEHTNAPAYTTVGYPLTPFCFLVPVILLLALLVMNNPKQSLLGALVTALGIPIYQMLFARKNAND
ncbi:MAG: amino acid permease [Pyrinomonadaceae bacterium]